MGVDMFIMGVLNSAYLGQSVPNWNLTFLEQQYFNQIQIHGYILVLRQYYLWNH